jgi:RNA polymerase sigma factor (sigma-70 family)
MSDRDLLQQYLQGDSQAFAALVGRHLNLVYSAALRQVRSSQLAEEVAQTVFLDLARRAHTFGPGQPVVAWLFVVTRRTAIDTLRSESRRVDREQTAAEIAAMTTPSPTWVRIKDEIDDALSTLGDNERAAILLRFFENKSLREVGSSLGISEDTAQKRVSRALDRLRDRLVRRGIAVSSVGLATDLSAHALHVAPSALGATIAAALPIGAAATATTPVAAAFLSHAVATTVIVGALGFAAIEAIAFVRQREEIVATRLEIDRQRDTLAALRTTQAATAKRLQEAREEQAHAAALSVTDPAVEAAIAAWLQRVERLKSLAATRSDLAIPEFAALGDDDWFSLARDAAFETEEKLGETFLAVRAAARRATAQIFFRALRFYADAQDGRLPVEPSDLAAHIPQPLPVELYSRYEMLQRGQFASAPDDAWLLAERLVTAQPRGYRVFVGRRRHGISEWPKKE